MFRKTHYKFSASDFPEGILIHHPLNPGRNSDNGSTPVLESDAIPWTRTGRGSPSANGPTAAIRLQNGS